MNRPHPPAPLRPAQCIASPKRGEGGQDLAFKVPLPLWERRCPEFAEGDLGRGNDIRARGLVILNSDQIKDQF
jgi:hypothetical protein